MRRYEWLSGLSRPKVGQATGFNTGGADGVHVVPGPGSGRGDEALSARQ